MGLILSTSTAIDSAHKTTLKHQKFTNFEEFFKNSNFRFITHKVYPESGFRTHFHASQMRAIDSTHKTTPKNVFSKTWYKYFFLLKPV